MTRYSVYPALWTIGHRMTGDKNYYLTLSEEEGINAIKEDMSKDVANRLNGYLLSASENQTIPYRIYVDQIPFTVNQINPEDIKVNESEDGMTFSVRMHVKTSYKDMRYEDTPTINVELPTRIIDMYRRAKKFDNEYETNVQWATTIALYMRAYVNGYNPTYEGSYLREGHITYDPIDTLLRADLKAFKNLSIDSITGVGSVPLTTWLTEWNTLGEPSFLPPGTDFDMNLPGTEKIINRIKEGSASKIYSGMIHGALDTIISMSGRSARSIASVIIRLSEHIRNMRAVDTEMKKIIGNVTASMILIAVFVGPVIGAVTTSLGYLIAKTISSGGLNGMGYDLMLDVMNPEIVKLIIGIYVLETTAILTLFADDLTHGGDKIIKKYHLGLYLPIAAMIFSVTTVVMAQIFGGMI
ncbi:MAG: hypothetical protein WAX07_04850 [Candidatus Altiarchaeia archaeon]